MENSNKNNELNKDEIKKGEFRDLIVSIGIYEAKSALAKLKLVKYAAEKGVQTIAKGVFQVGEYVDDKMSQRKEKK